MFLGCLWADCRLLICWLWTGYGLSTGMGWAIGWLWAGYWLYMGCLSAIIYMGWLWASYGLLMTQNQYTSRQSYIMYQSGTWLQSILWTSAPTIFRGIGYSLAKRMANNFQYWLDIHIYIYCGYILNSTIIAVLLTWKCWWYGTDFMSIVKV